MVCRCISGCGVRFDSSTVGLLIDRGGDGGGDSTFNSLGEFSIGEFPMGRCVSGVVMLVLPRCASLFV